jgi:hypothetical protein
MLMKIRFGTTRLLDGWAWTMSTVIFQAVGEVPEDFPTSQPCKEALRQGYASRKP